MMMQDGQQRQTFPTGTFRRRKLDTFWPDFYGRRQLFPGPFRLIGAAPLAEIAG
jgi:hypothetical protein